MGLAKADYEYWTSLRLKRPIETYVCSNHIENYAIKDLILNNGERGLCSYCKSQKFTVIEFEFLIKHVSSCLSYFYDDAGNAGMKYETSEGGYVGNTFDISDILSDAGLITESYELQKDLENAFDDSVAWCERDPYGDREHDELFYNWNVFKELVKHQKRYYFSNTGKVHKILDAVGRKASDLHLFRFMDPGTILFRCRQHKESLKIRKASDISSPPPKNVIYSNRMSPIGISMFYCAFDSETALKETINYADAKRPKLTTAKFSNKKELFLLDLTKLPRVPSLFDEKERKHYSSIIFLKKFIEDLSKDIARDEKEQIDYIPTQIVTEYFRYPYAEITESPLDGIIYYSSKNRGKSSCVLFLDDKQSLSELEFDPDSLKTDDIFS